MYVPCNIWDTLTLKLYSLFIWHWGLTRHPIFRMATLDLSPSKMKLVEPLNCMSSLPSVKQSYPASLFLPQQAFHFLLDASITHGPGPPTLGRQGVNESALGSSFITLLRGTSLPSSLSAQPLVSCAQICKSHPRCFPWMPCLPINTGPLWPADLLFHVVQQCHKDERRQGTKKMFETTQEVLYLQLSNHDLTTIISRVVTTTAALILSALLVFLGKILFEWTS